MPQELTMRLPCKFRNNKRELAHRQDLRATSQAPGTCGIASCSFQFQGHEILITTLGMLQCLLLSRVGQTVSKFKVRKIFFLSSVYSFSFLGPLLMTFQSN